MPLDLANQKTVRDLEKLAKATAGMDAATIAHIMSTQSGRAYIWRKLDDCHVFGSIINDNPLRLAFNEGKRHAGLAIFDEVTRYCLDDFVLMMREANERRAANERSLDKDGDRDDQGPDERQLDFYRDIDTGKIAVEWEPGASEAE